MTPLRRLGSSRLAGCAAVVAATTAATACGGTSSGSSTNASATPGGSSATTTTTSSVSTASPGVQIAETCTVGTWRATRFTIGSGSGDTGATLTVNADGTATLDYTPASPLEGSSGGFTVSQKYSGVASFRFSVFSSGRAQLISQDYSHVTYTQTVNGQPRGGGPVVGDQVGTTLTFTCDASSLVINDAAKLAVYSFAHA